MLKLARSVSAYAALPLVGLLTGPLLARLLGPEGRGVLAAVQQPLSLVEGLAALGAPAAATYFVARGVSARAVVRVLLPLSLAGGGIAFLALAIWDVAVLRGLGAPIWLLLVVHATVTLGAVINLRRGVLGGLGAMSTLDAERVAQALLRLMTIAGLWLLVVADGVLVAGALALSGLIGSMVLWRRGIGHHSHDAAITHVARGAAWRYAGAAWFGSIAISANARLDQAVLPLIADLEVLGFYAVAVTLAEVPLVLGTVLYRNVFQQAGGGQPFSAAIRQVGLAVGCAALLCLVLGVIVSWIVPVFFGEDFVPSVGATRVLATGTVLNVLMAGLAAWLSGKGHPGRASSAYLTSMALSAVGLFMIRGGAEVVEVAVVSVIASLGGCIVAGCLVTLERTTVGARAGHRA
ncbi:oligosaccharide flippase family protein [Modestobacter lapidis]|nr:oligosaccharide flippase family protein [Modestobacter lapidis]